VPNITPNSIILSWGNADNGTLMFRTTAPEVDTRVGWRAPERVRALVDPLTVGRPRLVLRWSSRIALHAAGAATIAVCVAVMLWNDIGPGPLDVLIAAIREQTGMPLMFAVWATIGTLMAIAWALGRRPGLATVLGPFFVAPTMQAVLTWLERYEPPSSMAVRILIQFLAVGAVGFGVGAVNIARLGSGSVELLTQATAEQSGRPEPRTRMVLEASWLAAGALLGGPVGLGTVVVALCIGPSIARGQRTVNRGIAASRRHVAAALRS
jgi:uncharacterized protein